MFESTLIHSQIYLGKQGEHYARRLTFNDVKIWREVFGEGRCELIHQRNGDEAPYPVTLKYEDGIPYWRVSSADTAVAGEGKCEIRYIVNNTVVKSNIYSTFVQESLGEGTADVPEPQKAWVDQVIEAGNNAKEYAEQAVESAHNADVAKSASEEYAEQSRIYAEQSEKNAQGVKEDAEYADLRANDAGASMQNAVYAAEQAQGYANEAKGYSDNASAKAEEVTENAEFIKDAVNGINSTFANALKGVVSGVGAVRLDAISPVPHDIEVKTDVDIGIKSYGKNILDITKATTSRSGAILEALDEETLHWDGDYSFLIPVSIPKGTPFTMSYESMTATDGTTVRIGSYYALYDDRGDDKTDISGSGNVRTFTPTKDVVKLQFYKSTPGTKKDMTIKKLRVEIGNNSTEFEAYKEPVDGVVLVHPTTTLVADNTDAKIEATYNKDINKAFAELTAAIISLGTNI